MGRYLTNQKIGKNVPLNMGFVRKVRNFINNFEVKGAGTHFHFDGYKAVLRIDRGPTMPKSTRFADHPWQLFQTTEQEALPRVSMIPGLVSGVNSTNSNPLQSIVTYTPADLTNDATTLFWAKVSLTLIVWTPYFKVWAVSAAVVETGATLPADTLNISTQTDGDVHVQIGSVTVADGLVTDITQTLFTPLNYNLPPILYGPEAGVHVLGSDDGDVDWIETEEFTCPEEDPE